MGLQVVIPIAGLGTRLRPNTYVRPKPLLDVAGKPILTHIVDQLRALPVDEVIFIHGHLGEQVHAWAKTDCPFPARFVEQKELRGQAHALSLVSGMLDRPTLIIFGDTVFKADLSGLGSSTEDGVLYVREVDDPRRFGIAAVESGYVKRLVEKPQEHVGNLAVVGIYYVRDPGHLMRAIDGVINREQQIGGEFYLADALQQMIEEGAKFRTAEIDAWLDCGTVAALLDTNRHLLDEVEGRSYVHPSAQIVDSTIGPHATIGANVRVERSTVHDSIVNEGAQIVDAHVSGSLVGRRAKVRNVHGRLNVADDSEVEGQ